MNAEREQVVAEALTWLKTPYHHQAHIKGVGVDCAQLLIEVYADAGVIERFDPRPYPPDWMLHRSEERYLGWVTKYAREVTAPLPGDMAVFRFGRCVSHAGIVTAWPTIVHAYIGLGCLLEDVLAGPLAARLAGFYSVWPGGDAA